MNKKLLLLLCVLLFSGWCKADEGMWIPMLLEKYNIEDMQKEGFKLTAEDIYDINQASLKDAVIGLAREGAPFRHFCTGEFISSEGLIVTNHHCVYGMVQAHTTLENNYLRDGFWAKTKKDELANPGITASILVRMEDVTEVINSKLNDEMSDDERTRVIEEASKVLEEKAVEGTDLHANVKSYFNGNQFFMSVFKIYKDIRLVGVPPSAIGKFGGDTDNWTWPRHTGDFSLIRLYAGEDNEPAEYAVSNRPYTPASFFKISTKGVQEGDFTMVFGYPGTTTEYLPSFAIDQLIKTENPHKIAIRTAKLNIIKNAMNSDELLRIKYSAKAAGVANAWKKWQGESKGLTRFRSVENKQILENQFQEWAKGNKKYSGLVTDFKTLYEKRTELNFASIYAIEAGLTGSEIIQFALSFYKKIENYDATSESYKNELVLIAEKFYKDFDAHTDCKILGEMLSLYNKNMDESWIPEEVKKAFVKKNTQEYALQLFSKSVFADPTKLQGIINQVNEKSYRKIENDPIYKLAISIKDFYTNNIKPGLLEIDMEINRLNRLWLAGLMEMQPEKTFYADANSTLRVAYGKVGGFTPVDAVKYLHYTTLDGIIEKDNPAIYDYNVPQKLRELHKNKDFGSYTQDGSVPVCFVANNHTTGGNSGSPVLDANGYLIGINFDRAWEGVMSDLYYSSEICRNIAVDIRYVLFIIDKLAGAGHLIEEMEIVSE
ncbi:S46 family peptidase [Odoribacter sp. OttesenSCG-928-J03]|nr:S46 family peptidase [Odoribacter sp. OttesenSCG-928-J03]